MERARTSGGVPVPGGGGGEAPAYTAEELALMRTQDTRYVAMAAGVEANEINRLTLQPGAGMWMHAEPRVVAGGVDGVYPPLDAGAPTDLGLAAWAGAGAGAVEE